jgi:hypothetical protein
MPSFDPEAAATQALSSYDTDSSGAISMAEASRSPGLADAFARIDKDGSSSLSQAELLERFQSYQQAGLALFPWSCQVLSNGRPLAGATVTLVPESFMGEGIRPATGQTDSRGVASPVIDESDYAGAHFGLYRIEISKKDAAGKELISAPFNEQSRMGQELASGSRTAESIRTINLTGN